MRKIFLILLIPFFIGCEASDPNGKIAKEFNSFYGGHHDLRKFSSQEIKTASSASASYFLFWGSASFKGEESSAIIAFSWKSNNGEYILSKIPMSKVRVKFDNNKTAPYVTFSIDKFAFMNSGLADECVESTMNYKLNYVIIHCKESDYPTDININDIK